MMDQEREAPLDDLEADEDIEDDLGDGEKTYNCSGSVHK
jgi:hypothetical protein